MQHKTQSDLLKFINILMPDHPLSAIWTTKRIFVGVSAKTLTSMVLNFEN